MFIEHILCARLGVADIIHAVSGETDFYYCLTFVRTGVQRASQSHSWQVVGLGPELG